MLKENIELMMNPENGMDIIIICVGSPYQEQFWTQRLNSLKPYITKKKAHIFVVLEDWPGGAGNGLGTLYSYQKVREQALHKEKIDITQLLDQGASVAIYHTAGSGQRLSPLTGSEQGDKSAVKLSGLIGPESKPSIITILEAVIRQTSIYAASRKGRISVFWGDQIFIPTESSQYTPHYHVDILNKCGMSAEKNAWTEEGLDKYGIIGKNLSGQTIMIDKVDFNTIQELINKKQVNPQENLGISLGSFSVSKELFTALLDEFKEELKSKKGKYDTDPHFWMPTTLNKEIYLSLMELKKVPQDEASRHYDRMQSFLKKNQKVLSGKEFFGGLDVGKKCYWWDYGTIKDYFTNISKLTKESPEADVMRQFFKLDKPTIDSNSYHIECNIKSGEVKNSILIGVTADEVNAEGSIVINSAVKHLEAKDSLVYNVLDSVSLEATTKEIIADTFLPPDNKKIRFTTTLDRDGKTDWMIKLPSNPLSYEEMSKLNSQVDKISIEKSIQDSKQEVITSILNERV